MVVSGHWETPGFALTGGERPPLVFDYCGFPPHTYQLRYDAPGSPGLAADIAQRLRTAGFPAAVDGKRGYDHGVFVLLDQRIKTKRYGRQFLASLPFKGYSQDLADAGGHLLQ